MHPAVRVGVGKSFEEMEELIAKGHASPYGLGKEDLHILPSAIKGRCGEGSHPEPDASKYNKFTGHINVDTGVLRIDNMKNLGFWLEVQLPAELMEGYKAWKKSQADQAADDETA